MPIDKGVVGFAATRKESVNIINAYSDERFNKEFDLKNNCKILLNIVKTKLKLFWLLQLSMKKTNV